MRGGGTFDRVVRGALSEEVVFEQKLSEVRNRAMQSWQSREFRTEGAAGAKALGQELACQRKESTVAGA